MSHNIVRCDRCAGHVSTNDIWITTFETHDWGLCTMCDKCLKNLREWQTKPTHVIPFSVIVEAPKESYGDWMRRSTS
jgi:hypothetical protein